MIKKLIAVICLLFLVTTLNAIPGCGLYWVGSTAFFGAGGSVQVINSDGSGYAVTASNFESGYQYTIQDGAKLYVWRPDGMPCSIEENWGYVYWCPCGICGPGQPYTLASGVSWQVFQGYISCHCPGGSTGGISMVTTVTCPGG